MESVVITGMGFVISLGNSQEEVVSALQELRTGIEPWNPIPGVNLPIKMAGTLRGFDVSSTDPAGWTFPPGCEIDRQVARSLPPHGAYAVVAVRQALQAAGLELSDLGDGETGLHCASAGSPRMIRYRMEAMEKTGWQRGHPLGIVSSVAGALNFNLAAHLGIRGANCGFVSACASSSHALGHACDEIRLGRQQRMIVVGAEDLNVEGLLPFHAMGALSVASDPALGCRPFDAARTGFVGTGGAAVMILESQTMASKRGATAHAKMAGWGEAADGYSIAAPHPDGDGIARAMTRAMADARVDAAQVDYVNAHATGTPAGDRAEALALCRIFGARSPAISSTKALTGHGLSLAGVMEAAFCVLALHDGFIPGQANLTTPLVEGNGLDFPRQSRDTRPQWVANNASGFGGANVCHLFTHA